MISNTHRTLLPVFVLLVCGYIQGYALTIGVESGLSSPIDRDHSVWSYGPFAGPSLFFDLLDNITAGITTAVHYRLPHHRIRTEGASYTLDISPAIKISLPDRIGPVNVYGRMAAGFSIISQNLALGGVPGVDYGSRNVSSGGLSFAVGPGIGIGDRMRLDAVTLFQVLFHNAEIRQNLVMGIGVSLGVRGRM